MLFNHGHCCLCVCVGGGRRCRGVKTCRQLMVEPKQYEAHSQLQVSPSEPVAVQDSFFMLYQQYSENRKGAGTPKIVLMTLQEILSFPPVEIRRGKIFKRILIQCNRKFQLLFHKYFFDIQGCTGGDHVRNGFENIEVSLQSFCNLAIFFFYPSSFVLYLYAGALLSLHL